MFQPRMHPMPIQCKTLQPVLLIQATIMVMEATVILSGKQQDIILLGWQEPTILLDMRVDTAPSGMPMFFHTGHVHGGLISGATRCMDFLCRGPRRRMHGNGSWVPINMAGTFPVLRRLEILGCSSQESSARIGWATSL